VLVNESQGKEQDWPIKNNIRCLGQHET